MLRASSPRTNRSSMTFLRLSEMPGPSDEVTGFGLGLSIARSIVLAHGGELSLNDRQPHGLMVRIRLPLRQPAVGGLSSDRDRDGIRTRMAFRQAEIMAMEIFSFFLSRPALIDALLAPGIASRQIR